MDRGLQISLVIVSLLVVGTFGFSFVASDDAAAGVSPPPVPRNTGSTPKFHVAEILTGVWCPPCGVADPALSRITDEWHDSMVTIAYHCCTLNPASGNYDPYYESTVLTPRDTFYGFQYLPTVVIDGGGPDDLGGPYTDGALFKIGSASPSANAYDSYRIPLEDDMQATSNVAVSITGDLTPNNIFVTVTVTATDPVPETNLFIRVIVYEDGLYWTQANGVPFHRNIARALNEQPITLTYPGSATRSATFLLNPAWNPAKLGVVAFVQSGTTHALTIPSYPGHYGSDILNAAKHEFVPRGILVHRDRGTVADYTEIYEQVLSKRNEAFDSYNVHVLGSDFGVTDLRGLPGGQRLADSSLLVWHTGPTSSFVLDASDQAMLSAYLDAGGSLLITGSDIGFDGWTTYQTWFKQYLHAAYEGDDSGYTTMTGVTGDPISDTFSATSLGVLGDPDRINTVTGQIGSSVPFRYTPTVPASVRAQHDSDSRVVYLGVQYFENTLDTNREAVMGKIIDWIDGARGPVVDVLSPDGGEQFDQGTNVDIRWHATDVRTPNDAVDIYFNDNYPSGPWQLLAAGEPNDGLFRWTLPMIDSAACRIKVVVRDGSLESGNGEDVSSSDFICGDPGFTITFTNTDLGWHLISFPTILADTSVNAVMASLAGSFATVRWYDAADASDPWKSYIPTKGGGDLVYLDNTMGFWVEVTGAGTFNVMGARPTSPQFVPLRTGWNLVSFPSYRTDYTVAQLRTDTGATQVEGFDTNATPYYLVRLTDTDTLLAGNGYWVYVPTDTVWTVSV